MTVNAFLLDIMNVGVSASDGRRIEVISHVSRGSSWQSTSHCGPLDKLQVRRGNETTDSELAGGRFYWGSWASRLTVAGLERVSSSCDCSSAKVREIPTMDTIAYVLREV